MGDADREAGILQELSSMSQDVVAQHSPAGGGRYGVQVPRHRSSPPAKTPSPGRGGSIPRPLSARTPNTSNAKHNAISPSSRPPTAPSGIPSPPFKTSSPAQAMTPSHTPSAHSTPPKHSPSSKHNAQEMGKQKGHSGGSPVSPGGAGGGSASSRGVSSARGGEGPRAPPPASHQEGTSGAAVAQHSSSPPVPKRSPPRAHTPAAAEPGGTPPGSGRRTPSRGGATPPLKKGSPSLGSGAARGTPSPTPKKGSPIQGGAPGRKQGLGGAELTTPAPPGSEAMSPPAEISSPELIACKATVDAVQAQWDSYVLARGQEWGLEALPPRIRAELSSFMVHALSELGQSIMDAVEEDLVSCGVGVQNTRTGVVATPRDVGQARLSELQAQAFAWGGAQGEVMSVKELWGEGVRGGTVILQVSLAEVTKGNNGPGVLYTDAALHVCADVLLLHSTSSTSPPPPPPRRPLLARVVRGKGGFYAKRSSSMFSRGAWEGGFASKGGGVAAPGEESVTVGDDNVSVTMWGGAAARLILQWMQHGEGSNSSSMPSCETTPGTDPVRRPSTTPGGGMGPVETLWQLGAGDRRGLGVRRDEPLY